jgi:hypothetical protein
MAGRTRLFTESDILALIESLRCPSSLTSAAAATLGICGGASKASLWTKAQRLLTKSSPNRCARSASGRSITRQIGGNRAVATFLKAAVSYYENGGEARFVKPQLDCFKTTQLSQIGQAEVKMYARLLYPGRATSTRQGRDRATHSGNFGGVMPNVVWKLVHLLVVADKNTRIIWAVLRKGSRTMPTSEGPPSKLRDHGEMIPIGRTGEQDPDCYRGWRALPNVEACASGFPFGALTQSGDADRCLQPARRTRSKSAGNREPSVEVAELAIDLHEHLIQTPTPLDSRACVRPTSCGSRRRTSGQNRFHLNRTVSWVMSIPRSISRTSSRPDG